MFLPARTSRPSTSKPRSAAKPRAAAFLQNLRYILPAVGSLYLGRRVGDGAPVSLPVWATEMNVAMNGKTGAGKTTTAQELDFVAPFDDMALMALDFIGTGHNAARTHKAFLGTLLFNLEETFPEILAGATQWFLRRFAFGAISWRGNNAIRIDILKRRRRPDGTLETVQEVVDRCLNVFSMRYESDMNLRVRFRKTAKIILAILVAAGRGITEWSTLLEKGNVNYFAFILREIETNGLAEDEFVQRQLVKLKDLWALSATVFEARTESFTNSMDDYDTGTALGTFFGSDETYDPAQAAFGNGRLFLTTDLPNETHRKEAFLAVHAINSALFTLRRPGTGSYGLLHYVLDEADKWVPRSILTHMAQARNLQISTWLLFQNIAQWGAAGIKEMADIRESVCSLNADYRPTTQSQAKELYLRTHPIDPMSELHRLLTHSTSSSTTTTETVTDSWQDAINEASAVSGNDGVSTGETMNEDGEFCGTSQGARQGSGWSASHGNSASFGGSRGSSFASTVGKAISETIIRIPFEERLAVGAQGLLRRPDHQATWTYGGQAVEVDMDPPRKFPEDIDGVPILEYYQKWHDAYWTSQAKPRPSFNPTITLVTASDPPTERSPSTPPTTTREARISTDASAPTNAREPFPRSSRERISEDSQTSVLRIVATIRLCTIQHIIALLSWSYDKASRELQGLVKIGAVEQIRAFAPRGEGSVPLIFILTTTGARILAEKGGASDDLQRIAKNLGVFRRTIEANRPAQTEHRLWSSTLAAFLIRSLSDSANATVTDVRFDRELSIPMDLSMYAIPDRERLLVGNDVAKAVYVPDFSFIAHRKRDGKKVRDLVFGEIETGFGERDARDLGAAKAWKMRAITTEFSKTRAVGGTTYDRGSELCIVIWNRTAALEERFFQGAKSVFGDLRSPLWITNGELVPLSPPSGTQKTQRAAAVASLVGNIQARVWRWLRFPDPTDRRRFVGTGGDK